MRNPLALHAWTLDSTPLAEVLQIARRTGWEAIELRRANFERAVEAGQSVDELIDLLRGSGLPLAALGVAPGWMFAEGAERQRLLQSFAECCQWATTLGCPLVMSPTDPGRGDVKRAAASLREAGDLAAQHGLWLAIENMCQAEQLNSLEHAREVVDLAGHPSCGLLLDTYHIARSGGSPRSYEDLAPQEIFYVQYSDVPASGLQPGMVLDRLPPGRGTIPFREIFGLLADKGYDGYLSYEAPNPSAWARDPDEVAREALLATRALLPA